MTTLNVETAKWIKGDLLGTGQFGRTYLALDASSGLLMAVKQVEAPVAVLLALHLTVDHLETFEHENLVQYLRASREDETLSVLTEYIPGGSVGILLKKYGALEELMAKKFTRQILLGLNYHSRGIIHGALHTGNVLVDNKGDVKLSDYGLSPANVNTPATLGHSLYLAAPEVFIGSGQLESTPKTEIWAMGCIIIEILTGAHAWAPAEVSEVILKLTNSEKPAIPLNISPDAQDFLQKTFDLDPSARPSADELLQHSWLTRVVGEE